MASLSTLPSRSIKLWNEPSVARSLHEHDLELQEDDDREDADHLSSDTQDRIAAGRERFFRSNARLAIYYRPSPSTVGCGRYRAGPRSEERRVGKECVRT